MHTFSDGSCFFLHPSIKCPMTNKYKLFSVPQLGFTYGLVPIKRNLDRSQYNLTKNCCMCTTYIYIYIDENVSIINKTWWEILLTFVIFGKHDSKQLVELFSCTVIDLAYLKTSWTLTALSVTQKHISFDVTSIKLIFEFWCFRITLGCVCESWVYTKLFEECPETPYNTFI